MTPIAYVKDSNGNNLKAFTTINDLLSFFNVSKDEFIDHINEVKVSESINNYRIVVKHYNFN